MGGDEGLGINSTASGDNALITSVSLDFLRSSILFLDLLRVTRSLHLSSLCLHARALSLFKRELLLLCHVALLLSTDMVSPGLFSLLNLNVTIVHFPLWIVHEDKSCV